MSPSRARRLAVAAIMMVAPLASGCTLFTGEPGQQQAAAVLLSCQPIVNGGYVPGPACEAEVAEHYQQYSNDLKDARRP